MDKVHLKAKNDFLNCMDNTDIFFIHKCDKRYLKYTNIYSNKVSKLLSKNSQLLSN